MRINKFLAQSTGLSRRAADQAIIEHRVAINRQPAKPGDSADYTDNVTLDGQLVKPSVTTQTIMLNKPVGYVCSRKGQGNPTIYELLPPEYHKLKPVGRLDKDSSGLLLLTDDGDLANQLTHPRYAKTKIYEVALDKPLEPADQNMISSQGVKLEDGVSKLALHELDNTGACWQITMAEGRNRQIRRTFEAFGYRVMTLNRTKFGSYLLDDLALGEFKQV